MNDSLAPDQLAALRDYAAGRLGTCQAIERTGLRDDAELIIALAQRDLALPRLAETPRRQAHLARARALLQLRAAQWRLTSPSLSPTFRRSSR